MIDKNFKSDSFAVKNNYASITPIGYHLSKLDRNQFKILGTAHFKLALSYTKKGWWEYALREAENSFELSPSPDTHELVVLIKEKIALQNNKNES